MDPLCGWTVCIYMAARLALFMLLCVVYSMAKFNGLKFGCSINPNMRDGYSRYGHTCARVCAVSR